MSEHDEYWKLLRQREFDSVSYEVVSNCAKMLSQLVPQDYRAGKMVSDLGEVWACTILQMKRMPRGHPGFDAVDEKGIVVINMARLGGSPVGISEKVSFTKVTLQALSDLPTKIQAAYVVRNSKNNIIAEGCIEQELKVRSQLPETYALFQNYPNPFNPVTTIKYLLSETSRVTLKVYNILGQEVRILVDKEEKAGSYSVLWDGLDEGGEGVASGVYLCKLEAADGCFPRVKKMVLIK